MKNRHMLKKRKSKGFTLAELSVVTAILGAITYYGAEQQEVKAYTNKLTAVEQHIEEMQLAYNQFYLEYRRPPTGLNELASEGFYTGPMDSPFGTPYGGTSTARGYQFTVNAADSKVATVLSERLPNASGSGSSQVQYSVPVPSLESIASQYLHREAVDGRPELNRMETSLDMNGFDISNVSNLQTTEIATDRITADVAEVDELNTLDELQFGANSISTSGTTLTFNADTVNFSNNLNVNGNLALNNTDISGVNALTANTGDIDDITAVTVTTDNASIDDITANTQTVDNLVSNSAQIDSATITNLTFDSATGNEIQVTNANITDFDANSAVIQTATINSLDVDNLTATSGDINNLIATTIDTDTLNVSGTATINTANINTLNSNTGTVGNLQANSSVINTAVVGGLSSTNTTTNNLVTVRLQSAGTATFNEASISEATITNATVDRLNVIQELVATTAEFNDASGNRIDFTKLVGNEGRFNSLKVNGTITAQNAKFDNADIKTMKTQNFTSTGTATIDTATANSMTVANTLTTKNVNGDTANFSGNVSAQKANLDTLTMSSYTINEIASSVINANEVSGGNYTGDNYYASDDFRTGAGNSVNGNRALYDSINNLWQSCLASDGCQ